MQSCGGPLATWHGCYYKQARAGCGFESVQCFYAATMCMPRVAGQTTAFQRTSSQNEHSTYEDTPKARQQSIITRFTVSVVRASLRFLSATLRRLSGRVKFRSGSRTHQLCAVACMKSHQEHTRLQHNTKHSAKMESASRGGRQTMHHLFCLENELLTAYS